MNKRRLLKLADLLEADAKNKKGIKFDMWIWGIAENNEYGMNCGTTACAMGLAAISGAFKRAGLGYRSGVYGFKITMNGRKGAISAARKLFDISENHAESLFIYHPGPNEGAKGERAVAKRIRKFVATGDL